MLFCRDMPIAAAFQFAQYDRQKKLSEKRITDN